MLLGRGARLLSAAAGRAGAAAPAAAAATAGKPIECLAAVAWAPKKEYWLDALRVEKIVVQPPKKGEVRVKITHAGTWAARSVQRTGAPSGRDALAARPPGCAGLGEDCPDCAAR